MPKKLLKNPIPYESEEQARFVKWFEIRHRDVRILAIPNGSKRSGREGSRYRREGVRPGVPDLQVPDWKLWIEMKRRDGGRLTKSQKDWKAYLESIGHTVLVCEGALDARLQVEAFLNKRSRS